MGLFFACKKGGKYGRRGGSSGSKGIAYKFNEQREMYITKHVSKYAAKNEKEFLV